MFNLLPNLFKDEIRQEYKMRRWIVLLSFVFLLQLAFLVLMFSLWTISSDKENVINLQIKKENETFSSQNTGDILKVINSTNQKLSVFDTVMNYPKVLPIYNSIISKKTGDISISDFNYISGQKESAVSLKGVSKTREALVLFVKSLNETGQFGKVDLPVSNLAKQKNIDFSINIKIIN